jgi:hypothetical protein
MKTKSLNNSDANGARKNVKDIKFYGDGDTFRLICKASSEAESWMKSTKAMDIPGAGCVVQITTQQRNPDNSYAIAEAVTFVPNVRISEITVPSETGEIQVIRKLVAIEHAFIGAVLEEQKHEGENIRIENLIINMKDVFKEEPECEYEDDSEGGCGGDCYCEDEDGYEDEDEDEDLQLASDCIRQVPLREVRFFDNADGVRGHYCIGFVDNNVSWFWNERNEDWASAGTLYVGVIALLKAMETLKRMDIIYE